MRSNNLGFSNSSASGTISNRNFNRMLDEINLNLQNFPLTSSTTAAIIAEQNNSNNNNNFNNPADIMQNQPGSFLNQRFGHGSFGQSQQNNQRNRETEVFNRNRELEGIGRNKDQETNLRIRDSDGQLRNQENNHNCREERKKQNSSPKIGDILTCFICLGKLKNAHMCPDCQKMCCEGCIKEWLLNKSQCPHCRSHLRPSKLMKCRFVGEITSALEKIEQIELRKEKQGICSEHDNQLQYYCQMCKHPVCSDCGMIGTKHKNHKFEKLNTVYDAHVSLVQNQLERLFSKLKELNKQQKEIDEVIKGIDSQRNEKEADVEKLMTYMTMKLQEKHKSKIEQLRALREPVQEEIDLLESMSEEINHHIETLPKSTLISKSSEIVNTLEEINDRRVLKTNFTDADKKLDFESEVIPPYDSAVFFLQNYTVKRKSSNVAYSDPLCVNGNEWRLKVYLNGNDKAKEKYLSVFIEMTKGQLKPSNFEYRIEMVNQLNRNINEARECVIQFEAGACWGYDKFFDLSNLEQAGFLLPESDMLIIKYQVRYASYYEFNLASQNRITELLAENEQLKIQSKNIDSKKWMEEVDLSEVRSINQIKLAMKEEFDGNSEHEEEPSYSKDHKVAAVDESKTENVDIENLMLAFDENKEVNISNQPRNDRTSDQEQSVNEENDEEEGKMNEEHQTDDDNSVEDNNQRQEFDDNEDDCDLNEGCCDQQSSLDQHQEGLDQLEGNEFDCRPDQGSQNLNEFNDHNIPNFNNQNPLGSNVINNNVLQQKNQEIAFILKGNSNACYNQPVNKLEYQKEEAPREEDDLSNELYSCLDEIGDKVNFIHPNDAQLYTSQLSINLKKNLLPEFEVEANRISFQQRQIENKMNKNEIKQSGEREQEFQLSKVASINKQDGLNSSSTSSSKREEAIVPQKIDRLFTQQYSSHYQLGAANLPLDTQQNKFQTNVAEKSEIQQFKKINVLSSKQITNNRLQELNIPNEQFNSESQEDNKDDSLLIMERKIEQLELLSKYEDQQASSQLKQQQQQQKVQQQQSQSNAVLPSQSSLAEARKQLISSISFPDDLIKKINKIKAQGTSIPTTKAEVPSAKPSSLISQIDTSKNIQAIGQSLLPSSVFEEKEKIITKSPILSEQSVEASLSKKKIIKMEETNLNSLSTQSQRLERQEQE